MKYQYFLCYLLLVSSLLLGGCGGTDSSEDDSTAENVITVEEGGTTSSNDDSSSYTASTSEETSVEASSLLINEIVADGVDGGSDWIELYAVDGPIDLANYSLVDDNEERVAQSLPAMTLNAGEFVVIYAIDEEDTPPESAYYVTFKLGSDDAVSLLEQGVQVDLLDWQDGDAVEGTSYGLFTDGINNLKVLSPTPGSANEEFSSVDDVEQVVLDNIINHDAALRVNEVVAKDSLDGNDWIELYVTGENSINLSDFSIADENNELHVLPNVTLAPGDFYRIFATTETLTDEESVGFKLGSNEQVSLFKVDDLIDQLSWKKGQALSGFSYGRYPDGSDATRTLSPTPEINNTLAVHGPLVINEVMADDIDGGSDWFELYNNSSEIIELSDYHVIDESDDIAAAQLPEVTLVPGEYVVILANGETSLSSDYSVAFKLGKSDELSLLLNDVVVDYISWDSSDVNAGYSYGLSAVTDDELSWQLDFLTPTPGSENLISTAFDTAAVQTLSITISDENWQSILANPLEEEYHEASISFNGVTLDSVAFRTKGGSSLNSVANSTSDRYSFKIDINEYVSGQKFFGLKKFTLQNSFNDPSYMREVIAYDLLKEMTVPAPEHSYVNTYINGELFGLYLMVEAVDGEFLENHFANANGDLYKPDGVGSDLQWLGSDIDSYSDINLQTNEESTDNGAFINFVEQINENQTHLVNVDTLLRYMAVSVVLSNLDSYQGALAHNYYLYEDDGVFNLLPWDFNEAFGTFDMGCNGVDVRALYIDEPTSGALAERPMLASVFANETYLATYHSYLTQLIDGPLANDTFNAKVESIANLIGEHVANDPSAFYSFSEFTQNLNSTVDRFYGLTEFMTYRVNNINQQLAGTLASAGDGSGFCGNASFIGEPPGR